MYSLLLTKLPSELRALIGELTLRVEPNDNDQYGLVWLTPEPRPRRSVLSLLSVCRQINHEAAGIFYPVNKIAVDMKPAVRQNEQLQPRRCRRVIADDDAPLARFLDSLSPYKLSCL